MNKPIVSVVIPVSNNQDTILRCISSCQKQKLPNIEIVVIINNSHDDSLRICTKLAATDERIVLIKSKVVGRSNARNLGLRRAKGEYINFLDADDTLDQSKLKQSVCFLEENIDYFAYANNIQYVDAFEHEIFVKNVECSNQKEMLYRNFFPINAVTFRNGKITLFEDIEYNEDWLFWVMNLYGKKVYYDEKIGGTVYVTGKNTMSNKQIMLEYFVWVRSLINIKFPGNFIRNRKSNIALLLRYFALNNRNKKVESMIEKNMSDYFFVRLFYCLPLVDKYWKKKLNAEWKSQLY